MKWKRGYLLPLLAVAALLVCLGIQKLAAARDTLTWLRQVDEDIVSFERLPGELPVWRVTDDGKVSSYVAEAKASGYGGVLTILAQFETDGALRTVVIADHHETPLYLNKVRASGLLELQAGKYPDGTFTAEGVDGVSGATLSTEAILSASRQAAVYLGAHFLGMELPPEVRPPLDLAVIVLLLFYAAALAVTYLGGAKKARPILLVASVVLLGFWGRAFLSYANFASLLTGNFPSFAERPLWHVLVFGVLLITLFTGRNLYCTYLCPFGAAQEGVYRALHLSNITPAPRLVKAAKTVRWVVLWAVLALAFLWNQPGLAGYEPFGVFFGGQGNPGQWAIMLFTLFLGIWWLRLWCRYFCPVGAILDAVAKIKARVWKRKARQVPAPQTESCPGGCGGACEAKPPLTGADKAFAAVVVVFNLLILHTVLTAILTL